MQYSVSKMKYRKLFWQYHKVWSKRRLLTRPELVHAGFWATVIECGFIPHSPSHVHDLWGVEIAAYYIFSTRQLS